MNIPRFLTYAGVGLLVLLIAAIEVVGFDPPATVIATITGIGATVFAVALWQDRPEASRKRFVSLGAVFCLYYAVSYGFAIFGAPPPFAERILFLGLDRLDLVALPVGILAWMGGYRLLRAEGLSRAARKVFLPERTLRPVSSGTLLGVFAVTVAARVLLVVSGAGYGYGRDTDAATTSVSSLNQYITIIGEFGLVILGLAALASGAAAEQHRASYRRAFLIMVPIELALRVLAGSKASLLLMALMVVFSLIAARRLSFSPRRLAATGIITVLIVFPLVGTYRDLIRPATGQAGAVDAPTAAVQAVQETAVTFADGPGAYTQFAFDQTAGRLREIDRAAVSIQAHDAGKPYSPPTEILERAATGAVPRVLWPGKPLNLYALDVSREYYGISVISASSLSPVGDAYRYGGLLAVAIGLGLLGGFVRFLDDMLSPAHSIWLVPVIISAIPLIRGGDLVGVVLGAVRYFVILAILYRFLFIRPGRTSVSGPRRLAARRAASVGGQAS